MRNALSYVPKTQQSMVAAALRQAFIQPDRTQRQPDAAPRGRPAAAEMAEARAFIDDSETDVLAHLDFPEQHRTKTHSTNPLERLNKEVKRRADVVGIFPNEASIIRLIGAVLLEQNDEWQLQHRYMQVEAMAELCTGDDRRRAYSDFHRSRVIRGHLRPYTNFHHVDGRDPVQFEDHHARQSVKTRPETVHPIGVTPVPSTGIGITGWQRPIEHAQHQISHEGAKGFCADCRIAEAPAPAKCSRRENSCAGWGFKVNCLSQTCSYHRTRLGRLRTGRGGCRGSIRECAPVQDPTVSSHPRKGLDCPIRNPLRRQCSPLSAIPFPRKTENRR